MLSWPNRTHVCSFSRRSVHTSPGPERVGGVWRQDHTCHHLHSTATVFCAGEAEDGLMPVSEDAEDVDTVVLDTERAGRGAVSDQSGADADTKTQTQRRRHRHEDADEDTKTKTQTKTRRRRGLLTFSLLLLQPLPASVDGRHLRLQAQVVLPDLLQLLLQEGDPLCTGHPVQLT